MTKPIANVMWTGGFDSTYRILQLSFHDTIIQPYYFYYQGRRSRDLEVATVKKLTEMIRRRDTTKAELRDVIIRDVESLYPLDEDIVKAYAEITRHEKVAPQNQWLAQAVRRIPELQISMERTEEIPEDRRVVDCVHIKPKKVFGPEGMEYYKLTDECPEYEYNFFKDYCFPKAVAERTKRQMYDDYIAWNARDIAENTWFCHYPRKNGEPCGFCLPCRHAVEELGEWRLKGNALKRHRHWRWELFKHRICKACRVLLGKEKRGL